MRSNRTPGRKSPRPGELALLLAAALLFMPSRGHAENLVQNGGFDVGTSGWSATTAFTWVDCQIAALVHDQVARSPGWIFTPHVIRSEIESPVRGPAPIEGHFVNDIHP